MYYSIDAWQPQVKIETLPKKQESYGNMRC